MILPILISVSVAPTSYFFWSVALTLVAPSIARAAERAASRERIAGILISLDLVECVSVFDWERIAAPRAFNTRPGVTARKSPPRENSEGRHFVEGPNSGRPERDRPSPIPAE